ncbi:MAG: hypothetical protein GWN58_11025 [Anaerolineae bacterium]|nr:hypothetical protein [Anaerolineae bacterium]
MLATFDFFGTVSRYAATDSTPAAIHELPDALRKRALEAVRAEGEAKLNAGQD